MSGGMSEKRRGLEWRITTYQARSLLFGLHFVARVDGRGIGKFSESCPTFRAKTRSEALAKAHRWCDEQEAVDPSVQKHEYTPINPEAK